MNDETHYQLLKLIEANPKMSQRELADAMGVSLGKTNYCLRAVVDRGLVKVKNFKANPNKRVYAYYLTPKGAAEKAKVTARFLKRKIDEYQGLTVQIEQLKQEVEEMSLSAEESKEQA